MSHSAPSLGLESAICYKPKANDPWGPWHKFKDDHFLAELHAKWWSKSILEEEEEWRCQKKSTVTSGHEFDSNEFGRGCYVLDIGIEGFPYRKIWVRADYVQIYDLCNEKHQAAERRAPCVVITGQPGIGKSVWIYYALRRRLSEGQPVIWYRGGRCILFVGEGAFLTPKEFPFSDFKPFIWTLVDSDEHQSGVPESLIAPGTSHFVIFVTAPNQERWSRVHKTTVPAVLIMNPWTMEEMQQVASFYEDVELTKVEQVYYRLGPTPRICIDFLRNPSEMRLYEDLLAKCIAALTLDQLITMDRQSDILNMDALSDKIILIRPKEEFELATVSPITRYVKSQLLKKLLFEERERGLDLFSLFECVPQRGVVAGLIYESLSQRGLGANISLHLVPMVKLDDPNKGKKLPHSGHQYIRNFLEDQCQQALWEVITIEFIPAGVIKYEGSSPVVVQGVYYIPESSNQVGFDSYIHADDGFFYIFHFTMSSNHDINPKMVEYLDRLVQLKMEYWRFVFLIPSESTFTSSQPRDKRLEGLKLFSAVLPVHRSITGARKKIL